MFYPTKPLVKLRVSKAFDIKQWSKFHSLCWNWLLPPLIFQEGVFCFQFTTPYLYNKLHRTVLYCLNSFASYFFVLSSSFQKTTKPVVMQTHSAPSTVTPFKMDPKYVFRSRAGPRQPLESGNWIMLGQIGTHRRVSRPQYSWRSRALSLFIEHAAGLYQAIYAASIPFTVNLIVVP